MHAVFVQWFCMTYLEDVMELSDTHTQVLRSQITDSTRYNNYRKVWKQLKSLLAHSKCHALHNNLNFKYLKSTLYYAWQSHRFATVVIFVFRVALDEIVIIKCV